MRRARPSTRLFVTAVAAGTLLLSGCAAGSDPAPTTPPASSASAATPAGATEYGLPSGTGHVSIQLWTDLSCPYCQMLEAATGDLIADAVADGTATLTIHPLNFVSGKHGDATDWSTRGANALAAALDAGEGDALPAFYAILQEHQTLADGTSHPSDDDILAFAKDAGVRADISDAVTSRRFAAWVNASNEYWLGATIAGTDQVVQGVPILVVDGTVIDLSSGDVVSRLQAAIDAAR